MDSQHIVKCRTCGKYFNAKPEEEGLIWVMPSKNYYYEKECYDNWKAQKERTDEDWVHMIYDFIARDLKVRYNWHMIESQRKKFINEYNFTNKGIYFTLYWYFYVRNNKWLEEYGIGLIPHIYEEATAYWTEKELKTQGVMKQIEDLARQRQQETISISSKGRRKPTIKAPE